MSGARTIRRATFAGLAALMIFATVAVAAVDRAEYKALVKADKLKQAGVRFAKAATALEKTHKELSAVEMPVADVARLTKWLKEIKAEVSLMRQIAAKFKAGDKSKGSSLAVRLQNNATKANNGVIVFQFNYCKIDPAKYT